MEGYYGMGSHPPPEMQAGGYGQGPPQFGPPPPGQFGYQGHAMASQAYGNYGQNLTQNAFAANAWQVFQMEGPDELFALFESKKSERFNGIQAEELWQILNQYPKIRDYYRVTWSLELCKIMLAMLDRSKDGIMQFREFQELLQCLTYWANTFREYDRDNSGFMEAHELSRVIQERYGYSLTVKGLQCLLQRYSKAMDDGRVLVSLDDFIAMSVRLRAYTEAFRARDRQANGGHETGRYMFTYDDFVQTVMCL